MRRCVIKGFIVHRLGVRLETGIVYKIHVFAEVQWYKKHVDPGQHQPTVSVWAQKQFVTSGCVSYLPVQRVYCKYAWAKDETDRLYVSAIPSRVFI